MKRLVSTKDLSHEEWSKFRKQGIGGSDAGAICGVNPYCTAMQVYLDKTTKEKKQIEQELKVYLGAAEIAENEHYRVSWKSFSSNRIDTNRLKTEQPEIYKKYLKTSQSRRFSVQAA